ncbi:MAG: TetR/AcrR family transcriptional regulator [Promethearchaeota archaeon]|nr:MAG: TetR/AcrR family transcriptional regulator [Candidatus Lokiarchaeota archaeon]
MKKSRARSPEKKAEKFQEIVTQGRELFLQVGSQGFSMRALAKKLKMSPGNLYNYVQSKRELWFATIKEDFKVFTEGMVKIVDSFSGSQIDLLIKIANYYFDFATEDFDRYKMMFMTPAPPADTIGPIEASYQPKSFEIMVDIVKTAMAQDEIIEMDPMLFTLFIWGIVHGNVELRVPVAFFPKHFITQMGELSKQKEFILAQLQKMMANYKKKK